MVSPLDALCDAIMQFEGWHPGSVSYRNRNPGNLRESRSANGKDDCGYCIFDDLPTGWTALWWDLLEKVSGKSITGLAPDSTLLDLMRVYAPASDGNDPERYAEFIADYITKATRQDFTPQSKLSQISLSAAARGVGIAEE